MVASPEMERRAETRRHIGKAARKMAETNRLIRNAKIADWERRFHEAAGRLQK